MEMLVADMVPDNPGRWLFHCHVTPHVMGGMQADYTVTD
jgi:hephaestin